MTNKNCKQCLRAFTRPNGLGNKLWKKRQFCNRACSGLSRKGVLRSERRDISCKVCLKIFQVLPHRVDPTYCSRLCQNRDKKGETAPNWQGGAKPCIDCGTQNKNIHPKRCAKCSGIYRSGKNNSAWKGGITPLVRLLRTCSQYFEWRKAVFARDKYTCVVCQDNEYINADHIKPFRLIIRENNISSVEEGKKCPELWDINNGRTLCVPCHKMTSTYGYGTRKALNKHICQ